jgi:chemotaxis protein methyltransferase CheR
MRKDTLTAGGVGVESAPELTPRVFQKISTLIHDKAGIELKDGKQALVSARLGKKLRETGCRNYDDYLTLIEADRTGESLIGLIDALSTNYTSFLRESSHFDYLKRVLTSLDARGSLEIWCAAASTGEEPYTLAITMLETLGRDAPSRCRILATDISTRALTNARAGVYPAERLRDVPKEWLSKYWLRGEGSSQGMCKIKPEVARMVEYRRLNLIEGFTHARPFPIVFCRNVMIYFDAATKKAMLQEIHGTLFRGGWLLLGGAETAFEADEWFTRQAVGTAVVYVAR